MLNKVGACRNNGVSMAEINKEVETDSSETLLYELEQRLVI